MPAISNLASPVQCNGSALCHRRWWCSGSSIALYALCRGNLWLARWVPHYLNLSTLAKNHIVLLPACGQSPTANKLSIQCSAASTSTFVDGFTPPATPRIPQQQLAHRSINTKWRSAHKALVKGSNAKLRRTITA